MSQRPRRSPSRLATLRAATAVAAALSTVLVAPVQAAQPRTQLIRDTEIEEIIHKECDPVFKAAGIEPRQMTVLLVQDKELNAFTLNGLTEGVNTGLIIETKTPGELVGVMAHETGHAAGGHPARAEGEFSRAAMGPMVITAGLGLLAILAGAPEAGVALLGSAPVFGELNALKYSRDQESRADQAAVTYLERAGLSGRGLVEFFDNFRYEEVFSEARRFAYFQSHPISSERIEALRRRAEAQKHYDTVDSPQMTALHEIMKAKLRAFTEPWQTTLVTYKEEDRSFPARYARAIAYYKALETPQALKRIDALLEEQPNNPYLWELKGQVYFESGKAKEAEAAHARAVALKPDAALLRVNLAQAILAQDEGKRADQALTHLKTAVALEADNSFAYRLMSQAYEAKGQGGQARLAAAEERFSAGDLTQARIFAFRARELLQKDTPEWRRATDIVLVSKPSQDDLKALSRQTGLAAP
jgi:predicted Zn-dependent protease